MAALLVSHHRPGFYFRVLEDGEVGAGDEITKVADGPEHITVADVDALLYLPDPSREQLVRDRLATSKLIGDCKPDWPTSLGFNTLAAPSLATRMAVATTNPSAV